MTISIVIDCVKCGRADLEEFYAAVNEHTNELSALCMPCIEALASDILNKRDLRKAMQ